MGFREALEMLISSSAADYISILKRLSRLYAQDVFLKVNVVLSKAAFVIHEQSCVNAGYVVPEAIYVALTLSH